MSACTDGGDPVAPVTPPSNAPLLSGIVPDSGSVGDTVSIVGRRFGAARGTSTISFGSVAATTYLSWNDSVIIVIVPGISATSNVVVTVNGSTSNGIAFRMIGATLISFANEIVPLFNAKGCSGCHGGNGGLIVLPYASLMAGNSSHGPVVTPGNGEGSVIVRKLRGTAGFGSRMPQGGSALSESDIQKFVQWINQGALNN